MTDRVQRVGVLALTWLGSGLCAAAPPPVPDEVKQAVLEVWNVAPKDQAEFFAHLKIASADLNLDGQPDWIVEVRRAGAKDSAQCTNLVLGVSPMGGRPVELFNFSCCDYVATQGRLRCDDEKDKRLIVEWKASWPRYERSTTRSAAKAAYQRGMTLLQSKKIAEAQKLLCGIALAGAPVAELVTGCGLARQATHDLAGAEQAFRSAIEVEPQYARSYLGLAAVAEEKKDSGAAVESYKKYLAVRPTTPERAEIEGKIAKLGGKVAPAAAQPAVAPVKIEPVDEADCGAICDKLLACGAGPWDGKDRCAAACKGAAEDKVARKTYRCAAKAKDCATVSSCTR